MLRPFFPYFGSKSSSASRYSDPRFDTIVEPFAGGAGYSLLHHRKRVILIERDPTIAEAWDWLIRAEPLEIMRIPLVDNLDDMPGYVSQAARTVVGLWFNAGMSGRRTLALPCDAEAPRWNERTRYRLAQQASAISHWSVVCGDYSDAPEIEATWFIDPPYQKHGTHYRWNGNKIDFGHLRHWCKERRGQTIVCEGVGATWLPFRYMEARNNKTGKPSIELIWTND